MIMGLPISIHLRGAEAAEPGAAAAVAHAFAAHREADRCSAPTGRTASCAGSLAARSTSPRPLPTSHRPGPGLTGARQTAGAFDVYASGWLDPSGIAKGWPAEWASRLRPADSYLNAGGDMAIRSPGEHWRIGIEHPAIPPVSSRFYAVCHGGVATSGSVHRRPHIIDPTTGAAASGIRQATVIRHESDAGPISGPPIVAAGNCAVDAGSELITRCLADGYDALLVSDDGSTWITGGSVHTFPRPGHADPTSPSPGSTTGSILSLTPDGRAGHHHSLIEHNVDRMVFSRRRRRALTGLASACRLKPTTGCRCDDGPAECLAARGSRSRLVRSGRGRRRAR